MLDQLTMILRNVPGGSARAMRVAVLLIAGLLKDMDLSDIEVFINDPQSTKWLVLEMKKFVQGQRDPKGQSLAARWREHS